MTRNTVLLWLAGAVAVVLGLALLAGGPAKAGACAFNDPPTTYEGPQDRSLFRTALDLAAFNMLLPGDPDFGLPPIEMGLRGQRTTTAARVPPVLLKAIAWIESALTQAAGHVPYQAIGPVLVSFDCGYGIMQVTSGMTTPLGERGYPSPQQALIATHFAYNIARGALILADKWNQAPEKRPIAGTDTNGDPAIIENWYFAVWSYNGFTGPGGVGSNHPLDPIYGSWPRLPYSCGPSDDGFGHNRGNYPYQELVFGCASRPPQVNGTPLWPPQPIDLPDLNDPRWSDPLALSNFVYPYERMDIPTPRPPEAGARPTATAETPGATPSGTPSEGEATASLTPTLTSTATPTATVPAAPSATPSSSVQAAVPSAIGHRDSTPPPSSSARASLFGSPSLSVSTTSVSLRFSEQTGADSAAVTISNPGSGILSWMAIPSAPWVTVTPIAGIAAGGDLVCAPAAPCGRTATLTISLDPAQVRPGTRTATVTVLAPGINQRRVITVTAKAVVRMGVPGVARN